MKHLYYARHGQSLANVRDTFGSKPGAANDLGLTALGKQQATIAAQSAAAQALKPDLMVCSPLVRAQETARILASALGYPEQNIETSDLFMELQFGILEGTAWDAYWESGKTYADLGQYAGAETIDRLQQRAAHAYAYLQSLPQDTILVVSHSAFGRALRRAIHGQPYTDEFTNGTSLPFGEVIQLV